MIGMTDAEFEKLVEEGIDALPERILAQIKNVAIVIADEPSEEQREGEGLYANETIFGLYEGIPLTERGVDYGGVLPDKITIFKDSILAAYDTPEDIKACVANTIWHELAHHMGWDDPWIYDQEKKRGKTR